MCIGVILERYWGGYDVFRQLGDARHLLDFVPSHRLRPRIYWAGFKTINDFLLPALCIKLLLRGRLRDHGFAWPPRREWWVAGALFLGVLPFVVGASFTTVFQQAYPRYGLAGRSWVDFLGWEGVYGYQFLVLEFCYRGFMLMALARHFGSHAIFVMVVPYAMIHFGKPATEALAAIPAGIILGTIALRSRSILGGFAIHCGVGWTMDILALLHRGSLQKLWSSG
jgi:hypothetical protein